MKKHLLLFSIIILFFDCSDNLDEGFDDANPEIKEKLVKRVEIASSEFDFLETYTFNYDSQDNLTSITKENNTLFFNYNEKGELTSFQGSDEFDDIIFNQLEDTYDVYEWGDVLKYDEKGNPCEVELLQNRTFLGRIKDIYIAHISYDPNPNPYFYSLKACGIINVLNEVDLNFSYSPPKLVKAKKLLPFNYCNSIIVKELNGMTNSEIHFDNIYDEDLYLSKSNVTVISSKKNHSTYFRYYYKQAQ